MLARTYLEEILVQFLPLEKNQKLYHFEDLLSADNAVLSWLTSGNRKKINEANRKSCLRSSFQDQSKKFFLIIKLELISELVQLRCEFNTISVVKKKFSNLGSKLLQ